MGRPRKFNTNDLAYYITEDGRKQYAVIVDWRSDTRGRGEYRIVRLTHPQGGRPYGAAAWFKSELLHTTGKTWGYKVSMTYRMNERLKRFGERGCECQCCVHAAIPRRVVRPDGTHALRGGAPHESTRT